MKHKLGGSARVPAAQIMRRAGTSSTPESRPGPLSEDTPVSGFDQTMSPGSGTVVGAPSQTVARRALDRELGAASCSPNDAPSTAATDASEFELPGYHIIKFFGRGGMGEVFLADRISSAGVNVRCVVKTIRQGVGNREAFENLFLDEARIVSLLRHPNLVSTIDVGRANGRLYLAMEWVDGVDAKQLDKLASERQSTIPLQHVLYILRETLQGLHYAHTACGVDGEHLRLVHRDISGGNIFISRHGAVKLADFGVALATSAQTETSATALAGKPHYFSPELWRGKGASTQSDIFALGVTFYEMLSGRPLFSRDKDLPGLAKEICGFKVATLIEEDLTLPDGLEEIVRAALHESLSERYTSAREFLEDVNDYAYEYGLRLLDADFADYIIRMLSPEGEAAGGRRTIWKS